MGCQTDVLGMCAQETSFFLRYGISRTGKSSDGIVAIRGSNCCLEVLHLILFVRLNHDFLFLTFCSSACMVLFFRTYPPIIIIIIHLTLITLLSLIAPGSKGSGSLQLILFLLFIPHHSRFLKKKSTLFLFLNLFLNVVQDPFLLHLSCWLMQRRLLLLTKLPTALRNFCLRNLWSFLLLRIGVLESILQTIQTLNVL